jgi:hypothetical protein
MGRTYVKASTPEYSEIICNRQRHQLRFGFQPPATFAKTFKHCRRPEKRVSIIDTTPQLRVMLISSRM